MKLSLDLGKHRRANVWLNELPQASFVGGSIRTISRDLTSTVSETKRQAALEVLVPVGPRTIYGLLGAVLESGPPGKLEVQISTSEDRITKFSESIAMKYEPVFVGLPREYVVGIEKIIMMSTTRWSILSSGTLRINCAAHGEISSNRQIFEHLTLGLVKLFSLETFDLGEEQLLKIFPANFTTEITSLDI